MPYPYFFDGTTGKGETWRKSNYVCSGPYFWQVARASIQSSGGEKGNRGGDTTAAREQKAANRAASSGQAGQAATEEKQDV